MGKPKRTLHSFFKKASEPQIIDVKITTVQPPVEHQNIEAETTPEIDISTLERVQD